MRKNITKNIDLTYRVEAKFSICVRLSTNNTTQVEYLRM